MLEVVNDKKLTVDDGAGDIDYYTPDVMSYSDYYPFGMLLPGDRSGNSGDYRYGFQGQEQDNEIKGEGNSVNYKYRMHDPRIGRFFAVDPLTSQYPHYTPYSFSGNRVIDMIELEGLEPTSYMDDPLWGAGARKHRSGNTTQVKTELFIKHSQELRNNWNTMGTPSWTGGLENSRYHILSENSSRTNIPVNQDWVYSSPNAVAINTGVAVYQINGKDVYDAGNGYVSMGTLDVNEIVWSSNPGTWLFNPAMFPAGWVMATAPGGGPAAVSFPGANGFTYARYTEEVLVGRIANVTVGGVGLQLFENQTSGGIVGQNLSMLVPVGGNFVTQDFTNAYSSSESYGTGSYRNEQNLLNSTPGVVGDTYSFSYGGSAQVQRIYYFTAGRWTSEAAHAQNGQDMDNSKMGNIPSP